MKIKKRLLWSTTNQLNGDGYGVGFRPDDNARELEAINICPIETCQSASDFEAAIALGPKNGRYVRTTDLGATRSERLLSALGVGAGFLGQSNFAVAAKVGKVRLPDIDKLRETDPN
ncbi:hypothetical protein [Sulfitobacter sp. HGT1]|uniref:hypothetical protein n=1 Tax=Sulfitobacter sp. HGT1 TaxID=2735435 RepID=UPI001594BB7C|nr:hypothetical protein [Sulfitobacter sp. HGT1]